LTPLILAIDKFILAVDGYDIITGKFIAHEDSGA